MTDPNTLISLPKEFYTEDENFIYSNLLKINGCEHAFYGVIERTVWDSKLREWEMKEIAAK